MNKLNLLAIGIITSFGMNNSFATEYNYINNLNNQLNTQTNTVHIQNTNIINNIRPKPRIMKLKRIPLKTIDINYKNVKLSKHGIRNIRLNLYKSFFSKDNNKFESYEDLMFAPTFLGKLVSHFHDQIRTGQYINNRREIRRIKNVFNSILNNIIEKTIKSEQKNNFSNEEINNISERISMAAETISISTKHKAPRIKIWDNIY